MQEYAQKRIESQKKRLAEMEKKLEEAKTKLAEEEKNIQAKIDERLKQIAEGNEPRDKKGDKDAKPEKQEQKAE